MDVPFFAQGDSLNGVWRHYVFSKHGPDFPSELEGRARIIILLITAFAAVLVLLVQRLTSGVPFFLPKNYRSFAVYNKKEFIHLYPEDEAPSQAPIEPLEGVLSVFDLLDRMEAKTT